MKRALLCATVVALLQLGIKTVVQAAEPTFRQQDLFISGIDDVNIYRIPTLLVTPQGTILAFCEARDGDDGDPTDIVLKRSLLSDGPQEPHNFNGYARTFGYGVNWQPMQVVAPGNGDAIMQTTPVVDQSTGTIFLCCYKVTGGLEEHLKAPYAGRTLLYKSDDDGVTWSEPQDLTPHVGVFVAGPSVGIQLQSGRLIIPGYRKGDTAESSGVLYSDDQGESWHTGDTVHGVTNEAQAVELADGTLMLNMRNTHDRGCRRVALSRDGGETWHKEYDDQTLPCPRCHASLLRFSTNENGGANRLLFSNPAARSRTNMTIKLSEDEGQSWIVSRTIHPGPGAYSCLAVLADGSIGLLYETGDEHPYEKITFAQFNLAWLTQ